jgi:hypothetical protein
LSPRFGDGFRLDADKRRMPGEDHLTLRRPKA